jgi:hypothetical protein
MMAAAQAALSHLMFDFGAWFAAVGIIYNSGRRGYMTNSLCSDIFGRVSSVKIALSEKVAGLWAGYSVR